MVKRYQAARWHDDDAYREGFPINIACRSDGYLQGHMITRSLW